jgi:hypothetical protein
MSSGAGEVLAEERRDDEGEGSDCKAHCGGGEEGNGTSESESSVSGEEGSLLKMKAAAMVKGRSDSR